MDSLSLFFTRQNTYILGLELEKTSAVRAVYMHSVQAGYELVSECVSCFKVSIKSSIY